MMAALGVWVLVSLIVTPVIGAAIAFGMGDER
jgi:hypothetical protein